MTDIATSELQRRAETHQKGKGKKEKDNAHIVLHHCEISYPTHASPFDRYRRASPDNPLIVLCELPLEVVFWERGVNV